VLLSLSRLLVWRHFHVHACWLRILCTGKMPPAPEKAICMPETVIDETAWKLLVEWEIRRFMNPRATRRNANLSESWHSVQRIG
jgi:hypothetical protein